MASRLTPGLCAGVLLLAVTLLVLFVLGAFGRAQAHERCGTASWYGYESCSNPECLTASGERFNPDAMTAAMPNRSEMGRSYRVRYRGRSVVVKVTDLGPHRSLNRIIDLSKGAFAKLAHPDAGVIRVCLERL